MIKRGSRLFSFLLLVSMLASCGGGGQSQANSNPNYKDTKTMVLDILKSDDGKKLISEAMNGSQSGAQSSGDQVKLLSSADGQQIQLAVKEVITNTDTSKLLQQMMKDPKFAGDFAKAIQKDNKELQKQLIKDPEYQKSLLQVMKNPEYEKMVFDVLKSTEYRQQIKALMEEAIQSPLYKMQLLELMNKAVQESTQAKDKGQGQDQQKQGEGQQDSQEGQDQGEGQQNEEQK
ncbi:spore germination lipoprotein GerD [Paenibacillus sp. y28]|uniref:spore germination lipoprotein GerD n=1 Tax=Paenibacillus sp. y28 TaxID=3129110 RepID=UPI0030159BF7